MKRWLTVSVLSGFLLVACAQPCRAAYEDGRTDHGVLMRLLIVEGRGLANAVALPLEIPRTVVQEHRYHRWLWPATFIPRMLTNIFMRATSAVNDVAFFPWILPFTDDISPLTEGVGLPEYPWNFDEEDF
jgi:hypothetical protein